MSASLVNNTALIDTSVLIGLYARGLYRDSYARLVMSRQVSFSVVTINEFIRGAHDPRSRMAVDGFLAITRDVLLTPTEAQWLECGRIAEIILQRKKRPKEAVVLLQNDILIAVTARDAGAILVTADKHDFQIIAPIVRMEIEYW